MTDKTCLIYNYGQHYRSSIFIELDKNLDVDFVFGDKYRGIKKIDYSKLINGNVKEVKNIYFFGTSFYFQKHVIFLAFKNYKNYIILGDTHCISTWILLFILNFKKTSKAYLWTHGWYGKENFLSSFLKKIFFNLSDGLLLYGNYAKKLMLKNGFNLNKLHVIFNSLDYKKQLSYRSKLSKTQIFNNHFNNINYNLIFIGRLMHVKKLDMLIVALKELRSQGFHFNLTLIGDGEKLTELKNLSKRLELNDSVWFYGPCYDESKISNLIYNADLCVSPGNVGLTAMHSLVYGTPVLTHNNFSLQVPEFEAIQEGMTGLFFKHNDKHSLALNINKWFIDKKDREIIRKNCFKIIDDYYNPNYQLKIIQSVLNQKHKS